jgi:hypothetical protein
MMCQQAVVDSRAALDVVLDNLPADREYLIAYTQWSDEFADGWHWVISVDCPNHDGPMAA